MSDRKLAWLREGSNGALLGGALRGIEKESLRVDRQGFLSRRPHPAALGAALTHPYLTTDYSEALLELITPPLASSGEVLTFLCDLHAFVYRNIDQELLWPASMPCVLKPDEQIPIARYGSSNLGRMKSIYRHGLGFRYGRAMQAIAGVHFNYSLPGAFWKAYGERFGGREVLRDFKSASYMALVRNYRRHAWLVMYLFGASPAFCKSFRPAGHESLAELDARTWYAPYATTLRMSEFGYRNVNQAALNISTDSLDAYVADLSRAVNTVDPEYERIGVKVGDEYRQLNANVLQIENEYYGAIRPKPHKPNTDRPLVALAREGIEYVEVRSLDVAIADAVGVNLNELRVLEALLLDCLLCESLPIGASEREEIDARERLVAKEGRRPDLRLPRDGGSARLQDWAAEILDRLSEVAAVLDNEERGYAEAVEAARVAVADPEATPSARLLESLRQSGLSFFEFVLEEAARHRRQLLARPIPAADEARLRALAAESLRGAEALEAGPEPSFEAYLEHYFRER